MFKLGQEVVVKTVKRFRHILQNAEYENGTEYEVRGGKGPVTAVYNDADETTVVVRRGREFIEYSLDEIEQ